MPPQQYTTAQAAEILGCSDRTITKKCGEMGLGTMLNPRLRLLTMAEIQQLKKRINPTPGNPTFGKPKTKPAVGRPKGKK